jgi:hypothetical protein
MSIPLLLVAAMTLQAGPVRVVRYGDERLKGITRVDVVVHETGDVHACRVGKNGLQRAATAALAEVPLAASVSEKASSWFYSLEVTTASILTGERCATSVWTELVAHVDGMPEADRYAPPGAWGSLLVGQLSLLRQSAVVSSPLAHHQTRLESTLRVQVAAIGGRIKAANP